MNELRVFENQESMKNDFKKFIEECGEDCIINKRDQTIKVGNWTIHWSMERYVTMYAAGREFNRIQCDCYVEPDTQRWLMSRIRGGGGWEPMISFWNTPHNFHW